MGPGGLPATLPLLSPAVLITLVSAPISPPSGRYMLWGLVGSQLGGCDTNMSGYGPDPVPVNVFLAEVFDIKLDFIW